MDYRPLFESWPLRSGLVARNRLVMAPMTTWSSNEDGTISFHELEYLRRRRAGVGIVITAACYVQRSGKAFPGPWGCAGGAKLESLRTAADVIHGGGALAVLQIHHGGRMCPSSLLGHAPYSASAIPAERPGADTPVAMTDADIEQSVQAFAGATTLAIGAGYDGVEIHGANTYLLQQFFSPHSNRRSDAWGGDLERRMRFPLAVTDTVLQVARTAGKPFIVGYRISPEEIETPGITLRDTLEFVRGLAARPLDWLHVSTRDYRAPSLRTPETESSPTRRIVEEIASAVDVIGAGMVHLPGDAAAMLSDGCAAAALGRILLMEPEWVQRVLEGRSESIRRILPATGGDEELTIPPPLYRMLLSREGWLPRERSA